MHLNVPPTELPYLEVLQASNADSICKGACESQKMSLNVPQKILLASITVWRVSGIDHTCVYLKIFWFIWWAFDECK